MSEKKLLRPVIVGDWVRICENPQLGALDNSDRSKQDVVDHHAYRGNDGRWRLWACIRNSGVGHLIYGWTGDSFVKGPWEPIGVVLRASPEWGEAREGSTREHVGAPFFVEHEDLLYCFFHSSGHIHLLVSRDRENFERVKGWDNTSRIHFGGRDAMVIRVGEYWLNYSCVTTVTADGWQSNFVIVRKSKDIRFWRWADYTIVSQGGVAGGGGVSAESPFVVYKAGYYYLFRSSSLDFRTYVYRSETPFHFGVHDDSKLITDFDLKAPEIFEENGVEYITHLADFRGLMAARLEWHEE